MKELREQLKTVLHTFPVAMIIEPSRQVCFDVSIFICLTNLLIKMKKTLLLVKLLILAVVFNANAQIGFEGLLKDYWNGSDLTGGFHSNNYQFVNYYNQAYGSWSGFARSRTNDVTTTGYANQYSAITGIGNNSSETYLTSFISSWDGADYVKLDTASSVNGVYVTNSTYAYLSMRDGDAYSKKFGGATGDDPDFFILTIKGFNNGSYTDSVNFYLADFRFSDNSQDYIVNTWTFVDLSSLNSVDSLTFELSSSDNGTYGMNTPAYFCIDDLTDENDIVTDFEDYDFDYWNGADLSGGFTSDNGYFYNQYTQAYGSWTGFAYSRKTDITTAGWANQYSAITGEGFNSSETYAVGNGNPTMKLDTNYTVNSIWVTNSTYAYLSMNDGDAFAKKFGGATGDDPDYFILTIKGYKDDVYTDSVNFYLADFRFSDNSQDYIVNTWTEVELTSLGIVDSLSFSLSSSDNGTWGMNTPAYFCLDEISTLTAISVEEIALENNISIYPNPVKDLININNVNNSNIAVYNLQGNLIYSHKSYQENMKIDFSNFQNGVYIISVQNENGIDTYKVIKQ